MLSIPMIRHVWIALLLPVSAAALSAQGTREETQEDPGSAVIKHLKAAPSCEAAADVMHEEAWGSSADAGFAPIAVERCEKGFFSRLPRAAKDRYMEEMQLCAYRYSRQRGTMYISAAALCQVDVAAEFAKDPSARTKAPLRTRIDCSKAQSPLERAVCSDEGLGHADLILAKIYGQEFHGAPQQYRVSFEEDQRAWLAKTLEGCHLSEGPLPPGTINCLRNEFERRFTLLDDCFTNEPENCLPSLKEASDLTSTPRASFDCEKPSSGMEIAICADEDLGERDIRLAEVYKKADAAIGKTQHVGLVQSERAWLRFANQTCPVGVVGAIPSIFVRGCLRQLFEERAQQLDACSQAQPSKQIPCLNEFKQ